MEAGLVYTYNILASEVYKRILSSKGAREYSISVSLWLMLENIRKWDVASEWWLIYVCICTVQLTSKFTTRVVFSHVLFEALVKTRVTHTSE